MQKLISTRRDLPQTLNNSVFSDRGRQFVERQKWDLCVTPQGYEIDEYDDDDSTYLMVHRHGRHMGSCRVRATTSSTMITDHFLPHFPGARDFLRMQKGRIHELTRFCRAQDISVEESKVMLKHLAVLLDGYRDEKKLTGFVAVVFPKVARFLDSIGVRYLLVSKSTMDGNPVYMICVTHAVKIGDEAEQPSVTTLPVRTLCQLAA
ncbi:acyl-homoserine-lactone synthase [uncultured Roseovarius sp.]|uniref:acyl-homoserine-lactone synthase n=1 Tax=uncultured Roseovarius sp. TaxID=293344 RepID=UPI002620C0B5|nr:acyl-homoserine-lactone synthase [uncultured Roseovarius sp.]